MLPVCSCTCIIKMFCVAAFVRACAQPESLATSRLQLIFVRKENGETVCLTIFALLLVFLCVRSDIVCEHLLFTILPSNFL